ncbi:hypothetical protein ACFX2I_021905 [Malus domestica]
MRSLQDWILRNFNIAREEGEVEEEKEEQEEEEDEEEAVGLSRAAFTTVTIDLSSFSVTLTIISSSTCGSIGMDSKLGVSIIVNLVREGNDSD